jgi:hypothetical protein
MSEEPAAQKRVGTVFLSACGASGSSDARSRVVPLGASQVGNLDALRDALSDFAHEWESSRILLLSCHGSFNEQASDETSLVLSNGECLSPVDVGKWYAAQKLPELIWSAWSSSSLLTRNLDPTEWPDVEVQPWTEVSQAERWLDNGSVVRWVDTSPSWPDPQRAYQQFWVTQVKAEGQGSPASAAPWEMPNWFTDLERREFFQRQADAIVDRLARYVRRKLLSLASRVRHVRPQVQRLAVRPLTMSVTVHAPPRPGCIEGPRALQQSLLAA